MSSHKMGESPVSAEAVIDAALLREVLPRHGPKRLARLMAVPVDTARHWFYRHLSAARCHELALKLLTELDEQDRRREAVRRRLEIVAAGTGTADAEMDRVLAGADRASARLAAAGAPAGAASGGMTGRKPR